MSGTYVAWNGREYPAPPPVGWELRSDGRYWPVASDSPTNGPAGFTPQYGSASAAIYALPEALPPPLPSDRVGPRPFRPRSTISLALGVIVAVALIQFVRLDILGFSISQNDFVGFDDNPDVPAIVEAPLDEDRELSDEAKDRDLEIFDCRNDGGAQLLGAISNPIDAERAYLINVEFFIDGERQLDGFAEVTVGPNGGAEFTARSASPALDGEVRCAFGDVFRFTPD